MRKQTVKPMRGPGAVELYTDDDPDAIARAAAADAAEVIRLVPDATVLFAVGESPAGLYAELARRRDAGELDTSRLRAIQLDEYLGVAPDDERAFFGWLRREVLEPLAIPAMRTIQLRGDAPDMTAECLRYDREVEAAGGIDLAILGIGTNGHLGFNEPPSPSDAPTRVVDLAEPTIESNARYWGSRDRVPRRAVTAGMSVLLAARRTILVVTGKAKHDVLGSSLLGPATPNMPASYLRGIPGVRVYADRAAWEGNSSPNRAS